MSRIYYFAYGSNLHIARFRRRVPSARVIGPAVLKGYRLVFDKQGADDSGKCALVPDADEVHGVVYEMAAAERPALDAVEGGYACRPCVVNTSKGGLEAYVYMAGSESMRPGLRPYHWYKLYVLHGARQHGLDPDYCARIAAQCSMDDPHGPRHRENCEILGIELTEVNMTDDTTHLPLASEAMERHAQEIFPVQTDPEEFAAKDGVGWMDFTFHGYHFRDPELDSWIHRVGKIITDPQALEAAQRKHLSEAEFMAVRKYMEDIELEDDLDL